MTTVVNLYKEPYDVYIGRGSKWGNPFVIGKDGNREKVIQLYEDYIDQKIKDGELGVSDFNELKGKALGCFCKPKPCHGDYLKKIADDHYMVPAIIMSDYIRKELDDEILNSLGEISE